MCLVLFFASPLVLVMYLHQINWHPGGQSYGELMKPPVMLKVPDVLQATKPLIKDSSDVSNTLWHDKWSMLMIAALPLPAGNPGPYGIEKRKTTNPSGA